jgi:hypothetical protein
MILKKFEPLVHNRFSIAKRILQTILYLDAIEENPNYVLIMIKELWK